MHARLASSLVLAGLVVACGSEQSTPIPPASLEVPETITPPPPPEPPPEPAAAPSAIAGSTRVVSSTEWQVTRAWITSLLADPSAAMGALHLIPSDDGSVRVFGITRTAPAAALGFQNGDTVTSVDGTAAASLVTTPTLVSLDTNTHVINLVRRGTSLVHTIRIVDTLD